MVNQQLSQAVESYRSRSKGLDNILQNTEAHSLGRYPGVLVVDFIFSLNQWSVHPDPCTAAESEHGEGYTLGRALPDLRWWISADHPKP